MRSMTTRIMSNGALLLAIVSLSAAAIRADQFHGANAVVNTLHHINIADDVFDRTIIVDELRNAADVVIEDSVTAHVDDVVIETSVTAHVEDVVIKAAEIDEVRESDGSYTGFEVEIPATHALEFHAVDPELNDPLHVIHR